MEVKKIYQEIWRLARPYYKKGRPLDIDHIEWMMQEALTVCKQEKIDDTFLMPLVILHDAGYAITPPAYLEKDLKKLHMKAGAIIARQILQKLDYPLAKIEKIVGWIAVHDNWLLGDDQPYQDSFILAVFNDLDFIWVVSPKGFPALMKVLHKSRKEMLDFAKSNEKLARRPFALAATRKLFERYLKDREKEIN